MRRILVTVIVLAAVLAAAFSVRYYARAAAFIVEAAGVNGAARRVAGWISEPESERPLTIPWRGGRLRARRYQPARPDGRAVLLVPGVHASGIDEPRLVGFARELAGVGHPVVTVELQDLAHYQITPRTTDMIEDAARWMLTQPDLARDGRIGMMGISFGGGLTIVAAGRPSLRSHVAFALSFGGHGDLPRTLQYLCTGIQPDGTRRPPHDYGVAIILLGAAARVVPPAQVAPLRQAILTFLDGSRLDMFDKPAAQRQFAHARTLGAALPEPARTLMTYVNTRDTAHLGPVLLPHVSALGGDPALSPDRSPAPDCPVYLLHGSEDNVIPAIESDLLARDLRAHGVTVHQLVTPLITHAEVDRTSTATAIWHLIAFWAQALHE
ncbi:MAG TPA: hypothetical protein VFX12_14870 [Vicinamibacterales bacterium]|nr:hypothetical protein [Vicinamibacterales bacterium]